MSIKIKTKMASYRECVEVVIVKEEFDKRYIAKPLEFIEA